MNAPGRLLVLTGASGSGKTTIAERFKQTGTAASVYHFDSIGVPSADKMVARYGSGESWQEAMTQDWMERLAPDLHEGRDILLEGQMRIAFVRDALASQKVSCAHCWLLDCSDAVRRQRLEEDRSQPELATADMMNWARYLREEARSADLPILDTGTTSIDDSVARIAEFYAREDEVCTNGANR